MGFLFVLIGFSTLVEGIPKLDKHPVLPSAYVEVGIGVACFAALVVAWWLGRLDDD